MRARFKLTRVLLLAVAGILGLSLSGGCQPSGSGDGSGISQLLRPGDEIITEITVTGDDRMRFRPTRFVVEAGSTVTVRFHNIGVMSKETMGHNWALLDGQISPNSFAAASIGHPMNEYIAPELEHHVISTTKILGPGEEETVTFTAPAEPGEYPYVCSFPGHTPARMVGTMIVVPPGTRMP